MKKTFYYFLILFTFSSCDPSCQKLMFVNNTSDSIFYRLLTDTILKQNYYIYSIGPNDSTKPLFVMGGCGAWEYKINKESMDSTLYVFVLKTDKLNDSIISNHEYKRFDFKVKDLDSLKWRIVYN